MKPVTLEEPRGEVDLEVFEPGTEVLYRPSIEDEQRCYEFGSAFAEKVMEYHARF